MLFMVAQLQSTQIQAEIPSHVDSNHRTVHTHRHRQLCRLICTRWLQTRVLRMCRRTQYLLRHSGHVDVVPQVRRGIRSSPHSGHRNRPVQFHPSTRASKKFMAVFTLDSGRTRTVHFGAARASDYTQHRDPVRKQRYLARHTGTIRLPRGRWRGGCYGTRRRCARASQTTCGDSTLHWGDPRQDTTPRQDTVRTSTVEYVR